jgi:hypothetical protein
MGPYRFRSGRTASTSSPNNAQVLEVIARALATTSNSFTASRTGATFPDAVLEHGYAGLFFLGPAAFRHFLPAYMS